MRYRINELEKAGIEVHIEEIANEAILIIEGTESLPVCILDCIDRLHGKLNSLHVLTSNAKEEITHNLGDAIACELVMAAMKKARML
jgi:hypothetical protein